MRYTVGLRTSRKNHALRLHRHNWWSWSGTMLLALVPLGLILAYSGVDANQFLNGFATSLVRVSVAYLISLVLGIIIPLLIMWNGRVENVLLPIFDVLQSFPSFILIPVLAVALSRSPDAVVVAVLVIAMIWPLVFGVIGGIKNRREDLEEAATIFGAEGWRRLQTFTLPALYPSIVTGSIISWGDAWDLVIGAELLIQIGVGVGRYLGGLGQSHQNGRLTLAIIAYLLVLFVINKLIWLPLLARSTQYQSEN